MTMTMITTRGWHQKERQTLHEQESTEHPEMKIASTYETSHLTNNSIISTLIAVEL